MLAALLNLDFAGSGAGAAEAMRHGALLLIGVGVIRLLAVL